MSLSSTFRWIVIGLIAFYAMSYALTGGLGGPDLIGYVQAWGGAMFKCMSGGCLGFGFSRVADKLDLSALPEALRPNAALGRAIIVGAGMIGVPLGS